MNTFNKAKEKHSKKYLERLKQEDKEYSKKIKDKDFLFDIIADPVLGIKPSERHRR